MNREQFLKELKEYGIENTVPNVSETNAKFLRDLIKIQGTKNMLEIGTANAYSSINFGIELEKTGGKLLSIDFSPKSFEEAKNNVEQVNLTETIRLVLGNAIDEIPKLEDFSFDFIFIDGMKKRSKDFLDLSWNKAKKGGIIIIDDVIKFSDKMSSLWTYLNDNNINYNIIPLDIEDGILMIIKD